MSRNDPVDIEVAIIRDDDSDLAILVSEPHADESTAVWLPRSQIEYTTDRHGRTTVTMKEWLAEAKGLI
jgi:hypothetical protein